MSIIFRKFVVPNLLARYYHSDSSNLVWFNQYNNLYKFGVKNEAMVPIKEFRPIYLEITDKKYVLQGETILTVETDKTTFDLYSPFDAKIIGFNNNLIKNLDNITNYEEIFSWLFAIKKY